MAQAGHRYRIAAYRGDEAFAFVSYAHDDSADVFVELDTFSGEGLPFYYDEGIHPGRAWDDEVANAILKCAVFVFFVTARSAASQNCRREIALAVERDKPVIAVYLEDVELPPGLRLSIGNRQAIFRARFDAARYRERLVAAIREHVGTVPPGESDRIRQIRPPAAQPKTSRQSRRWWIGAMGALSLIGVGAGAFVYWHHNDALRVAHAQQLAKIEQLVEKDQCGAVFTLAHPLIADHSARADPKLQALWNQIVEPGTPLAAEAGATLSYKAYDDTNDGWVVAGKTPIAKPLDLPKGVVRFGWKSRDSRRVISSSRIPARA